MEQVLADTLLAQSRDLGALLRAVCGGDGAAALSVERLETLRFLLQRLAAGGGFEGEALRRAAWEVALERCLPLLRGGGAEPERRRLVRAACGALRPCARLGGAPLAARLAGEALEALRAELPGGGGLGPEAAVEALVAVVPALREPALLERAVGAALSLVRAGGRETEEEEVAAGLVAGRLLPALAGNRVALRRVWEGLLQPGCGEEGDAASAPQRVSRTLLAVSALAHRLFPDLDGDGGGEGRELDARLCEDFWQVVQEGLTHRDGLCRKRARYLLKRAVDVSEKLCLDCTCPQRSGNEPSLFWWSVEKNVTVVLFVTDCWLFHPSWHMCIYKRMFESENKTLTKEGVAQFLELYETKCLPNSPGFSEFIIGPLMDALSESSLYGRSPGQLIGACPPLGMKLQKFLSTYLTLLPKEEKSIFLLKFIQKMTSRHWCAVPILFLSMALACIPSYRALGAEGLHALRDVLQCTMITHQILLRGAAQCFLLQTAMHLTDVVSDFFFPSVICYFSEMLQGMSAKYRVKYLFLIFVLCSEKRNSEWIELKAFLHPLLEVLLKLGTNAYILTLKTDKSLQLLLKLLQNCSLKQSSPEDDLDRCNLYLALLSELMNLCSKVGWKKGPPIGSFISSLITASIQNLQEMGNEQIQKVVSMASLTVVCEIIDQKPEQLESLQAVETLKDFISSAQLNQVLKKPFYIEEKNSLFEESTSSQGWGKIVASYIHDQWLCLQFILNKSHKLLPLSDYETLERSLLPLQKPINTLQSALEALTLLPSDQVLPVFHCMKVLVPKLLGSSESLCIEAFDLAWKVIYSLSNTQLIFWSNLKAFVRFVFDTEVLAVAASSKGQAYSKIKEIILRLIEMSAARTGVFNTVLSYCCQSWLFPASDNTGALENPFSNAGNYIELITEACVFGTVFRRDQRRLIQDVHAFVENLGDECAANVVTESTNRDDHYVRVCSIKFLCLLDGSSMLHKTFMEDLVIKLLDKDELVSKSRTRYYVNSLQHRIKNRLWQTLLVLFPKLDQNFLTATFDKILHAGFGNNQASIKYLIEWIIILSLHKYPQFLEKFWNCFCYGEEKLKTSICTFLSVLSHFDIILENTTEKKPILKKALLVVLQWCFNHNFSVRLYALVALKKIWGMCKSLCVEEFEALTPVIESSLQQVENMHGAGNAKKNWQRIQDHFFFATFHPLKDYSLETVFYTLPRLSELVEDEWIPLCKFTRYTDISLPAAFHWCHSRTELLNLKPSDWSQQDIGSDLIDTDNQAKWTDVQKKIIPWKNNSPDLELELVFQDRAAKLGKSNSRLIVVASLIDKPTNLGGLCRTSEIFGASALVVGSLHYLNDKQFQHLSVSAEQWLPLVEVKPAQLVDYLQQKKTEGYTIIGVEQTAKSLDLTEYSFPEKSLLLLGNEHEGIPANLIQQLDVCVEIPQQGIIRSLNVHVSGALLIWEYTRQQMIKQKQLK
uniref:tRNA (guanosine(18)-2'-O)-methyltransferase TARBP1 n=1 Tax=Pelusios castaneus TaxID=367368 RepID=A0A8C8SF42_9SAUR